MSTTPETTLSLEQRYLAWRVVRERLEADATASLDDSDSEAVELLDAIAALQPGWVLPDYPGSDRTGTLEP